MRKFDTWLFAFVTLLAAIAAIGMFLGYYQHPEFLWRGDPSDRSSHFGLGLRLALALRNLDPAWFWYELEFAKLWPPVHGLILSVVLLAGGLDVRLGIIPNLIGWAATVSMTWVIARRFFADQITSIVAASVAVIFALASPAFRLLATDVMLECLGSALTALSIYFYMRTYRQPQNELNWRFLAITLTLLFFEKYNYWGLAIIALSLTHILQHRNEYIVRVRLWWQHAPRFVGAIALDPAVLVCTALVCFVLYIYWAGLQKIIVFGWQISVYPPENLITIAYAILYGRLAVAWFRHRQAIDAALGVAGRTIFYWHFLPVTVSFLIPRRLSWFLWVAGPTNTFSPQHNPLSGLLEYYHGLAEGFTVAPWAATLAVLLALIALTQWRKFAQECQATFVLVVTCSTLVILHPNHQARFLASWVFAVWICAGVGAALIFQFAMRRTNSPTVRAAVAGCAIAALALATGRTEPSPAAAGVAHQSLGPSEFDLLPAYLPDLADSTQIGLLRAEGGKADFLLWNAGLQCRCRIVSDWPGDLRDLSHDETVRRILSWVRNTDSEVIVGIFTPEDVTVNEWLIGAMKTQDRFRLVTIRAVPSHRAEVMIWRR